MDTQALVFIDRHQVTLQDITIPEPGPGEVLIETAYSAVSPGTELRCFDGKQIGAQFPFIPGYSQAGTIIAVGEGVEIATGTRVFSTGTSQASIRRTWGGHSAHAVRPADSVFPLPDNVDMLDAAMVHMAAIAYHGLRLNKPQPHEQIAVIGLGLIGQFAARLHTLTGAYTVAADLSQARVDVAQRAGIKAFVPEKLADFRAYFPQGADSVVDATGFPAVLNEALGVARDLGWDDIPTPGARYVVQGSYPADFSIDYNAAFGKEIVFLIPRDCQPRDFRTVIDLLSRERLQVRDLIGEVAAPDEAQRIYETLQSRDTAMITAAFKWH